MLSCKLKKNNLYYKECGNYTGHKRPARPFMWKRPLIQLV